MRTARKAQASRENGRHSHGPTSAEGKARVRLNALKSGIFSRELVISAAGETQEDFERLRAALWQQFKPRDATAAILVNEVAISYWRLSRTRRCEAGEIRKLLDTAIYRCQFDRTARVNSLKSKFIRSYVSKSVYLTGAKVDPDVIAAVEAAREQLMQSAAGLKFFTETIQAIEAEVRVHGFIPRMSEVLLIDACGIEDEIAKSCVMLNKIATVEMNKIQKDKNTDTSTFEANKQILLMALQSKIHHLKFMERTLERLESAEEDACLETLVLPEAERADRIHRAEAAHQRSLYRALDRLLALPKSNAS